MKRKEVEDLVNKYGPIFQKELGLLDHNIRWHVHLEVSDHDNSAAVTMLDPDGSCDIVVHYEVAFSRRDVVGTIYHELLHVMLNELLPTYKKSQEEKAHLIEEMIIRRLEKFFDKYFIKRILG